MFRPVLLRSDPEACAGPPPWTARVLGDRTQPENLRQLARAFRNYRGDTPAAQRYVHLTDGGVADNFGLLSLQLMREAEGPPAPLTVAEALQARRILLLVVNAEYIRPRTFQTEGADAIGAYEMLYSPLDVATDVAKREAVDLWRAELAAFERELRAYRCALPIETRGGVRCDDLSVAMDVITFHDMAPAEYEALYDTATDVSLPADTVSALIAAGQGVARRNAALAALRG
jgi:NTE family protein